MFNDPEKTLKIYQKRKKPLEQKSFLPDELVKLVDFVFKEQLKVAGQISSVMGPETVLTPSHQLVNGKPLLPRESFSLDHQATRDLLLRLLKYLKESRGQLSEAAEQIQKELDADENFLDRALQKYLAGDDDFFRKFGEKTPAVPRCLNFLVQAGATPSIARTADALSLLLPRGKTWNQGHCPVCGSLPYISELREKQGFRYLHCSFCHSAYLFKRMACPFCSTEKSDSFQYFETREIPGVRVHVCTSCSLYIKTIDFREMDKKVLPPLDDLESLPLDIKAKEEGYNRPTLSVWGF